MVFALLEQRKNQLFTPEASHAVLLLAKIIRISIHAHLGIDMS